MTKQQNFSNDKKKLLIIDTSVLLYDPNSIKSFGNNEIILPLIVLEELDRFKDKQSMVGSNARIMNRILDDLRSFGSLAEGITVPETNVTIKVISEEEIKSKLPNELDPYTGDNKIIAVALGYKALYPEREIKIISKDINLRVKCDALGINADDYYTDLPDSVREGVPVYTGWSQETFDQKTIEEYWQAGLVTPEGISGSLVNNQMVLGVSYCGNHSMIGMYQKGNIVKLQNNLHSTLKVDGRSKEQKAAIHLLCDTKIPLVSLTGIAGSGKTFLSLVAGLSGLQDRQYERIIITRSIEPVGKDIGFLPGTLEEKMDPWMMPIIDNFRNAFGDQTWLDMMRQKGQLEMSPISHIRGRSFKNSFVIVDECQNLTIHELKTIITRAGEGTKMILLGDTDQVDTPYLDKYSNGLTIAIEKLKGSDLYGHIHLDRGERSKLATLGSALL